MIVSQFQVDVYISISWDGQSHRSGGRNGFVHRWTSTKRGEKTAIKTCTMRFHRLVVLMWGTGIINKLHISFRNHKRCNLSHPLVVLNTWSPIAWSSGDHARYADESVWNWLYNTSKKAKKMLTAHFGTFGICVEHQCPNVSSLVFFRNFVFPHLNTRFFAFLQLDFDRRNRCILKGTFLDTATEQLTHSENGIWSVAQWENNQTSWFQLSRKFYVPRMHLVHDETQMNNIQKLDTTQKKTTYILAKIPLFLER